MPDGLRNHEIAEALVANERAMRSLASSVHEWATALRDVERQLAQVRSAVETLTAVQQTLTDLRRDELNLERDKVEREITGEVARVEAEAKARADTIEALRDGARGFGLFLQTRSGAAVLFLCGMIVAWGMGTAEFADLATRMLDLWRGTGGSVP